MRSFPPILLALALLAGCERAPAPRPAAATERAPPTDAVVPAKEASPAAQPASAPAALSPDVLHGVHDLVREMAQASAACRARGDAPTGNRAVSVHRWTDANGITHYSDRAPPAGTADHRVLEVAGAPPIRIEASGHDVNLPDDLQQRALSDALGVQRVLHDTLGIDTPPGITLRIVFVRDARAYADLVGEPALSASAGVYSPRRRTIYVRTQANDESSFAVLRHEMTHALVHEAIGNLPTPLNEGLAEYFGRFHSGGLGGTIDLGLSRAAIARAAPAGDGSDALVDLLAREGTSFYAVDAAAGATREARYLRAYGLVAFLMRDGEGRTALASLLRTQQGQPCAPIATEAILDATYPGGLLALARGWADSMRDPPVGVRAY